MLLLLLLLLLLMMRMMMNTMTQRDSLNFFSLIMSPKCFIILFPNYLTLFSVTLLSSNFNAGTDSSYIKSMILLIFDLEGHGSYRADGKVPSGYLPLRNQTKSQAKLR